MSVQLDGDGCWWRFVTYPVSVSGFRHVAVCQIATTARDKDTMCMWAITDFAFGSSALETRSSQERDRSQSFVHMSMSTLFQRVGEGTTKRMTM